MTNAELLENFNKTDSSDWFSFDDLCGELDLHESHNNYDYNYCEVCEKIYVRVKKYWQVSWICTDTKVGHSVYTFDDKPFAISSKRYRKSDEKFQFVSYDAANSVRNFLLSLVDPDMRAIKLIDMDAEVQNEVEDH